MEKAHPVGACHFNYFPQEPPLMSTGVKVNILVMYIFDNLNHTGYVLCQRVGHVHPSNHICYQYSSNGGLLVSMTDGTTDVAACRILSCGGKCDRRSQFTFV